MIDGIRDAQAGAPLDQQLHHRAVAIQCRQVQRRRVGMQALWILAVRVFTGVEQDSKDVDLPKLCA